MKPGSNSEHNNPSKILALDASTGITGYAVWENGNIVLAGYNEIPHADFDGDRLLIAWDWIGSMIGRVKPDLLIIEDYFFRSKFATGANLNPKIRGVYEMASRKNNIPYVMPSPPEWKKAVAGRAYPDKAQKKKWKAKANKMIIVEALEGHGIICPKKIINPITNKKNLFPFDVSDAIGMLLWYCIRHNLLYNCPTAPWNFQVAE